MSNSTEPCREREDALRSALIARVTAEGTRRHRLGPRMVWLGAGVVVAITAATIAVVINARAPSDDGHAADASITSELPSASGTADANVNRPPFDTGTWHLSNPAKISAAATAIDLDVTRLGCAGGDTGTVLAPEVTYAVDRIVIRTPVAALPDGVYDCMGNDSVPLRVQLSEPVGARQLVDAECLDERPAATTAACTDGPVRWSP